VAQTYPRTNLTDQYSPAIHHHPRPQHQQCRSSTCRCSHACMHQESAGATPASCMPTHTYYCAVKSSLPGIQPIFFPDAACVLDGTHFTKTSSLAFPFHAVPRYDLHMSCINCKAAWHAWASHAGPSLLGFRWARELLAISRYFVFVLTSVLNRSCRMPNASVMFYCIICVRNQDTHTQPCNSQKQPCP
jgi:hypothetical protein